VQKTLKTLIVEVHIQLVYQVLQHKQLLSLHRDPKRLLRVPKQQVTELFGLLKDAPEPICVTIFCEINQSTSERHQSLEVLLISGFHLLDCLPVSTIKLVFTYIILAILISPKNFLLRSALMPSLGIRSVSVIIRV
jgi:hypothetical protein